MRHCRKIISLAAPLALAIAGALGCSSSSERPGEAASAAAATARMAPLPAAEQARLRAHFDEKSLEATNSLGMRFRLIFPGTIETRAGTAVIKKPFYLGACEVTQAEYEKVTGENPSHFRGANLPADSVNWDEALAFCRRLSEIEGAEYRLPTEAEWDYACGACAATDLWSRAPVAIGDCAWVSGNSGWQTHPVGLKKPNAWGLHDMHGNVWEWCQVVPGAYARYTAYSRALPGTLRGGSWADAEAGHCELVHSFDSVLGNRLATHGFRVVRALP